MFNMTPELFDKWYEALLSDKYKQGMQQLYNSEQQSYCALGVLADLICEEYQDNYTLDDNGIWINDKSYYMLNYVPYNFVHLKYQITIVDLNDKQGVDFKIIAQYIRKNRENIINQPKSLRSDV